MKALWKVLFPEFLLAAVGFSQGQLAATPSAITFLSDETGTNVSSSSCQSFSGVCFVTVTSTGSPLSFSASSSADWLSVTTTTPTTPGYVIFSLQFLNNHMNVGTYSGTITLTSNQATNSPLLVPVTLTVVNPTLVVSPATLTFSAPVGGTRTSQGIALTSTTSPSLEVAYNAAVLTGNTWLSLVGQTGGDTPATLAVVVNPIGLAAGTYNGSIAAIPIGGTAIVVPVTLTITTTQPPTITSLVNAASFLNQSTSPGEVVSIFGANIGPPMALQLQLDNTGKVSTSLGNVQVLFSGHPAPLTYVSAAQINCVVPYEVVGVSNPTAQVNYSGQNSNAVKLTPALVSPGIFATNGTGQGAILNQDGSVNGPAHPAAAGNIVSIFMTGEGQTSPPGITGSVTCNSGCNTLQQIPVPVQPITALVGNQPATVTFYGEAPGLVAGVLQVNLQIPSNAPSGSVPLVVSVGGTQSQTGVTLSVR